MTQLLSALAKSIGQLGDPVVARLLLKSAGLTLLVFVALGFALFAGLSYAFEWAGWGESWLSGANVAGAVMAVVISTLALWFLFRIVAVGVLQFFADEIVIAVEERHYPEAAASAQKLPFRKDLANSLRGMGRALLFNALALPLALILVFTAIGPAIVFLTVNAVLLGRELTDMGWLRHCGEPPAPNPVPKIQRLALGAVIAAVMMVPLANFLAPILGAAAGTHLVQQARAANGARDREGRNA